jgi:asparagine synthase (glutamine-hydrolysing)
MCGVTGIFAFNLVGKFNKIHVTQATISLEKRGPDFQDIFIDEWVGLGHRRLSIIDTSSVSNQPMWDEQKRYCIVFNGEIFNFRDLRKQLTDKGVSFFSGGDTEVLLKLYIHEKEKCLEKLNGFFSFCIYDKVEQSFFLARDRYGIKPLLYCYDDDKFLFASEMKSIIQYGIDRTIDFDSLYTYLQLNYIPAPATIFKSVKKLLPGHYLKVKRQQIEDQPYYEIPYDGRNIRDISYDQAQEELRRLLDASVQRRLVADVPLGAFLSGGIDSSIITGIARKYKSDLHTFSIGFKDEKFFDETHYANLVAKHFRTNHTVFSLTNDDLYSHVHSILAYIDEPFADSSALAVSILSKETRKHATVALSGDGADELLGGYNKHSAFYRMINPGWKENLVTSLSQLWKAMPKSRNNRLGNLIRQLERFSDGSRLSSRDRYWKWAGYASEHEAMLLFRDDVRHEISSEYQSRKQHLLRSLPERASLNDILLTDTKVVLPNDMLTKVDLMSMFASLEVRVPFLDFELVNFIFSLPDSYKIDGHMRKRILQDAYRSMLPMELYNRPKKGFEVPLLKWFRREMKSLIVDDLLTKELVEKQGIFNHQEVEKIKKRLFSSDPGDVHARIWALIVFQTWWKKYSGNGQ